MEGAKMRVGNQEQVCVKLDRSTVIMLDTMARNSGVKKNRIINVAIYHLYNLSQWR